MSRRTCRWWWKSGRFRRCRRRLVSCAWRDQLGSSKLKARSCRAGMTRLTIVVRLDLADTGGAQRDLGAGVGVVTDAVDVAVAAVMVVIVVIIVIVVVVHLVTVLGQSGDGVAHIPALRRDLVVVDVLRADGNRQSDCKGGEGELGTHGDCLVTRGL